MKWKLPGAFLLILALLLGSACTAVPGVDDPPADPLTGRWSGEWGPDADRRNPVELELRWDGASLQGVVNPGPRELHLTQASFDPKTGAITMELDALDGDGRKVYYRIAGEVEGNTMAGSWSRDHQEGDFMLSKSRQ